jgi:hypothetical protein
MQWSDLDFKPSDKTLRLFAVFWGVFFAGLACLQHFKYGHETAALVCIGLAVPVCLLGLIRPQLIRPVFVGATVVAFPIGWTVSRILLALTFYLLFTPLALFFKLIRRDALLLRSSKGRDSYWAEKPMPEDPGSYFRQF